MKKNSTSLVPTTRLTCMEEKSNKLFNFSHTSITSVRKITINLPPILNKNIISKYSTMTSTLDGSSDHPMPFVKPFGICLSSDEDDDGR